MLVSVRGWKQARTRLNSGMAVEQILLGMSVLKQLKFTQRGDTSVLRAADN